MIKSGIIRSCLIYDDDRITEIVMEGIPWIRQRNGTYKCKHFKRRKCTIYEKRPRVCKFYICQRLQAKKKKSCKQCKNTCCEGTRFAWDDNRLSPVVKWPGKRKK